MIKEQLISFDTSKLAKKFGVDIDTNKLYTHRGTLCESSECDNQNKYTGSYGAYTQSLLQKWFREVHDIHVIISPPHFEANGDISYNHFLYSRSEEETGKNIYVADFSMYGRKGTYEDSLEEGLQEAFKYIKS